jgi:hypothetical protein
MKEKQEKKAYTYCYEFIDKSGKFKKRQRGVVYPTFQDAKKEMEYDLAFLRDNGCNEVRGYIIEIEE